MPWNQRVWHVGLALDQDDVAGGLRLGQAVQPVEAGLAARLPAEAVAVEGDPEPYRQLLAARPEIGNADGGLPVIGDLGQPAALQEVDRERLRLGVLLQGEPAPVIDRRIADRIGSQVRGDAVARLRGC